MKTTNRIYKAARGNKQYAVMAFDDNTGTWRESAPMSYVAACTKVRELRAEYKREVETAKLVASAAAKLGNTRDGYELRLPLTDAELDAAKAAGLRGIWNS